MTLLKSFGAKLESDDFQYANVRSDGLHLYYDSAYHISEPVRMILQPDSPETFSMIHTNSEFELTMRPQSALMDNTVKTLVTADEFTNMTMYFRRSGLNTLLEQTSVVITAQ
jgi:hypothetical protein